MRKVFSFNSELGIVTGVQRVLMDIHHALQMDYESKIVGLIPYDKVNSNHGIKKTEYVRCLNPFMFKNSIVIVHERKFLFLFWILNHLFSQKILLIYIHHNMLYGHKLMTVIPKHVVCISERGRNNLIDEFSVKVENIHKIYNCVVDRKFGLHPVRHSGRIRVLYPAYITEVKRQLEIVENLKGKLTASVDIIFAGIGPLYSQLKEVVEQEDHFVCQGFVEDVPSLMMQCDYVMLFSKYEGLPVSLIEATMTGTPIICNDVGGNTEICRNGENGFVINDWGQLVNCLNSLGDVSKEQYEKMSEASRTIYKKNFTFEMFKRNYLDFLNMCE